MDEPVNKVVADEASAPPGGEEKAYTVAELANRLGGRVQGSGAARLAGVNGLDDAGPQEITFISDAVHARRWGDSRAGAAVVSESVIEDESAWKGTDDRPQIIVPDAGIAVIALRERVSPPPDRVEPGIHKTAVVAEEVEMDEGVGIGPLATVGRGCSLGRGVMLYAGVHLYGGVSIGDGSILHAGVVVRERCVIGRGVIIHQNSSIGADGFGYLPAPDGSGLLKAPHLGIVVVEDEVEIGANTCIDRAKFGVTRIGAGTKIDNLVQIAHNVNIGKNCVIAGGAGIAGSATLGDWVQVGGQVGVVDHVTIGDGVRIGTQSGVLQDIDAGEYVIGIPADKATRMIRQWSALRRLPDLIKRSRGTK